MSDGFNKSIKGVNMKLTIKDFVEIVRISDLFTQLSKDKEFKYVFDAYVRRHENDVEIGGLNFIKISNILEKLPNKETSSKKITNRSSSKRNGSNSNFTQGVASNSRIQLLYDEVRKEIPEGKLRFDQTELTCHSDIKVMFYKYISMENLKSEKHIKINKFLRSVAPLILTNDIKEIRRNDLAFIWKICSEIRNYKED